MCMQAELTLLNHGQFQSKLFMKTMRTDNTIIALSYYSGWPCILAINP